MTTVETPRLIATTITANGTLAAGAHTPVNAAGGAVTVTLPTGVTPGSHLSVEKEDSSGNVVTISGSIRGVGSSTLSLVWQYESVTFVADSTGGSWWVTAGHKTKTAMDAAYASQAALATLTSNVAAAADVLNNHGNVAGTATIDLSTGNYHVLNLTGALTLSFTGWPASGTLANLTLEIASNGYAITWPAGWKWLGRVAPVLTSGTTDLISAVTRDGGTTVLAAEGKNYGTVILALTATIISLNPLYLLALDQTSGATFADTSGNSHPGTPVGGVTQGVTSIVPSDSVGKSATFDGSTGYITETLGPIPATNSSAGAFSVVFGIKAADPGTAAQVRVYASSATTTTGALFSIFSSGSTSNRLVAQLRNDAGTFVLNSVSSTAAALDGNPHLVVFTYSNGAWAFYVDGAPAGSGTVVPPAGDTFTAATWAWGALKRTTASNFVAGTLDALAAFSRALTSTEVGTLFTAWQGA